MAALAYFFAADDLVLGSVETLTLNAEWFSSE